MQTGQREQRFVFGEVAELYDRARAGYPEALVDETLAFVQSGGRRLRALEVGAGTSAQDASGAGPPALELTRDRATAR